MSPSLIRPTRTVEEVVFVIVIVFRFDGLRSHLTLVVSSNSD